MPSAQPSVAKEPISISGLRRFLVAEFHKPQKVYTFSFIVGSIIPKSSFIVGSMIPKSVKCIHSATRV